MRLIDADRMKTTHEIQMGDYNSMESIREWIDRQPTAYDVEAVAMTLEEKSMLFSLSDRDCIFAIPLNDAIEIAKRGGRNETD